MFEPQSRYFSLEDATFTTPEGRRITYKRRRFLPEATQMEVLLDVTVNESDRLDLIAAKILGDPEQYWRICDANNAMNPRDLTDTVGRTLHISASPYSGSLT